MLVVSERCGGEKVGRSTNDEGIRLDCAEILRQKSDQRLRWNDMRLGDVPFTVQMY
jgi:hypothetical protein